MSSTFSLFRLPLVVLALVINKLDLHHVLCLSLCSQRSRNIAKLLRKRTRKTVIEVYFGWHATVDLTNYLFVEFLAGDIPDKQNATIKIEQRSDDLPKEIVKIGGLNVEMKTTNEENSYFYFDDKYVGWKLILEYVTNFFESEIEELVLSSEMGPDKVRKTMDWVLTRQNSIPGCHIEDALISDDQYRKVLDVCKFAEKLFIDVKPTDPFFHHEFQFKRDLIIIYNSFWISIDNLLNFDSRVIQLKGSKFTNIEINRFLKRWMISEGSSKLKRVDIEMENINLNILLEGLNAQWFPEGVERKYINEDLDEMTVSYGFDIQRIDGTLATIVHDGIDPFDDQFFFVVW